MALLAVGVAGFGFFVVVYFWASAQEKHLAERLQKIEEKRAYLRNRFRKQKEMFENDDCAVGAH